jgi:hypothetical protein
LKEAVRTSETSEYYNETTRRYITEESKLHKDIEMENPAVNQQQNQTIQKSMSQISEKTDVKLSGNKLP